MKIDVYGTRHGETQPEYLYSTTRHKTLNSAMKDFYSRHEIVVASVPTDRVIRPEDYNAVDFYRVERA